jgi:hypothetical protein
LGSAFLTNELINYLDPMQDWSVVLLKVGDAANISRNNDLCARLFAGGIELSQLVVA